MLLGAGKFLLALPTPVVDLLVRRRRCGVAHCRRIPYAELPAGGVQLILGEISLEATALATFKRTWNVSVTQ